MQTENSCCGHTHNNRKDWLLIGAGATVILGYILHFVMPDIHFFHAIFDLINTMWWGLAIGLVFIGILSNIPKEFVSAALGAGNGLKGILRATLAGMLFDLCSHGILMVGMKLYERGASLGQVMAFLIASPWNSFSLTFILIALIGLKWTLLFVLLSAIIAVISGMIFNHLTSKGILPNNPHTVEQPKDFQFWKDAKAQLSTFQPNAAWAKNTVVTALKDSRVILKWLLVGVVLASLIRAFVPAEMFTDLFGPTFIGLFLTMIAATIIEVCSEGSAPIAADITTRAGAPGNGFAFLMAGVSTDYTEIMILKETMKSWKIALFLPLVTLPQIFTVAFLINLAS